MVIADVGGDVTFSCIARGGPDNEYQWQHDGGDLMDGANTALTIADIRTGNGGNYTCVVSNAAGSDSATAILYVAPTIVTQPMDILTRNRTEVNFTCEAEGFPTPTYQWEKYDETMGAFLRAGSGPMLEFSPAVFGDEGSYRCVASLPGINRNDTSAQVVLTGRQIGIILVAAMYSVNACSLHAVSPEGTVSTIPLAINADRNTTVEFVCSAWGGPGNNFTWTKVSDGAVVTSGSVLQIAVEDAFDGGDYRCLVVNDAGSDADLVTLNGTYDCVFCIYMYLYCIFIPLIQLLLCFSLNPLLQTLPFLRTSH